ncbi:hypothetical protein PoB_005654400 [Plakobranchus ocellatus]|uniref:C-type lectin domain-containing protein n=1 Tax=Plakobranchus ocellatus TaxID=259542 RepID=A0AAV4CFT9_9GAST|nr:hypothetical protein PoB_005654400 [Plakobranchus ocellatus]
MLEKKCGITRSACRLFFITVFVYEISSGYANRHSSSNTNTVTSLTFVHLTPSGIFPFYPYRLLTGKRENIPSALTCAQESLWEFPASRGFLFNSASGLCTPLLWLQGPAAPDAHGVQASEGTLYLEQDVCNNQFQLFQCVSTGQLACLRDFSSALNYRQATAICNSFGGYLVAVKTSEKLDIIRSLSNGGSRWVGLDDQRSEGIYVWQSDGTNLTMQQQSDVFLHGEPNNVRNVEHCVQLRNKTQKLNDIRCYKEHRFICERSVPGSTC